MGKAIRNNSPKTNLDKSSGTALDEKSNNSAIQENKKGKIWFFLVGISDYDNNDFAPLPYAVNDCNQLLKALIKATPSKYKFKEAIIHHNCRNKPLKQPRREAVMASLKRVSETACEQDLIIFYFTGHGALTKDKQEAILCLKDTRPYDLLTTGLKMQELLQAFSECKAQNQLLIIDSCHSSGRGHLPPMLKSIESSTSNSQKYFIAIFSCDDNQQSLQIHDLKHSLFTYYLIAGLRGEAANKEGNIDIYDLYKFVYHKTLEYIKRANEQVKLSEAIKKDWGILTDQSKDLKLQTPKILMETIGEITFTRPPLPKAPPTLRKALIIDGISSDNELYKCVELGNILDVKGNFDTPRIWHPILELQPESLIQEYLQVSVTEQSVVTTILLYFKAQLTKDALVLPNSNTTIPRSWLKEQLKATNFHQQIVIFDCVVGDSSSTGENLKDLINEWISELTIDKTKNQCLIAAVSDNQFIDVVINTLKPDGVTKNGTVATWLKNIENTCSNEIKRRFHLEAYQVLEILQPKNLQQLSYNNQQLDVCPYMGLNAFTEKDAVFFYGRENITSQLLKKVETQPFVAVIGASGSGKSSLVQAGLVPRIPSGIVNGKRWWIKTMRPGTNPLEQLIMALSDRPEDKPSIRNLLKKGTECFAEWLTQREEPVKLLIIDQFEELFTLASAEEREKFLLIILEALENQSEQFKVVITLRVDFLSNCLEIRGLYDKIQESKLLVPPSLDNYREVIVKPAESVGLKVEEDLVKELLKNLEDKPNTKGNQGNLPILEFVLEQLWEKRCEEKGLTLSVYTNDIEKFEGALDKKAKEVYDSLTIEQQECAKWIFLQLTELGDGKEDTRRVVLKKNLYTQKYTQQSLDPVLEKFVSGRLIVKSKLEKHTSNQSNQPIEAAGQNPNNNSSNQGNQTTETASENPNHNSSNQGNQTVKVSEETVEVAHEIIIRAWELLQTWLKENRDKIRNIRALEQDVQKWKSNQENKDLLLRGLPLTQNEIYYQQYQDDLSEDTKRFIRLSLQKRKSEKIRNSSLTGGIIAVILGFVGWAWSEQQKAQREQLLRYAASNVITPENSKAIIDSLPEMIKSAEQLKKENKIDEALDNYRNAKFLFSQLQGKIAQSPEKFKLQSQSNLTDLSAQVDTSLVETLRQYRLPELEKALSQGDFGKMLNTDLLTYENRFSGALKITFAILMRNQGIYADRNNDGDLNEGEETAFPCQTLKDIEQLWLKYTNNQCSWLGPGREDYFQANCKPLEKNSLMGILIYPPSYAQMQQALKQCQITPPKQVYE